MRLKPALVLIFSCSLFLSLKAQTPKTLLWRVTGNNLAQPSYLYGTMHSNDKRVYFLGDSVYSSLEFCEGFATEIDPTEYIDTMVNSIESEAMNTGYKDLLENKLVAKDPNFYHNKFKAYDSAYHKLLQRYRNLSSRDLARLRRVYKRREKNDMRTILDLFLFDLAKKQGKIVGGIEDINDQLSIQDELGNTFDPDQFLKSQQKKYVDVEEWMVNTYVKAELDQIYDFSKQANTARQQSLVLYNRNNKMARRVDSLAHIRSTFCAMGTAHLPGDSGVITLLRKRGFTVTPVFSVKIIEPGDRKITGTQKMISITDADSNYTVQMPGKPTKLTRITEKLYLKTYKELANEIMLMHGLYEDGDFYKTVDDELNGIKRSFSWNDVKLYSTKKITRQGLDGYNISFKNADGYMQLHIFYQKGKVYMFAAGSRSKDSLEGSRCNAFFDSYKMNLDRQPSESPTISYISASKAFSVSLPGQPKEEHIKGDATSTKEDITLFTSADIKKKTSFLVLLKEPFEGFFTGLDSSIFTQTLSEIKSGLQTNGFTEENTMLDGYPALKVKLSGLSEGRTQVVYTVLAIRHNRLYNLTARGFATAENEQLFDKFINSFHFLPYTETAFTYQVGGGGLFRVKAPSPVKVLPTKRTGVVTEAVVKNLRTDYYAYDSNRAISYGITALAFNKYYWAANEKELLNEYESFYFNDALAKQDGYMENDSLLYKRSVFNGGIPSRELMLKNSNSGSYTRIRILHYADSVFVINTMGAKEMLEDAKADSFFNSFSFINEQYTSDVFKSKTGLLLEDLHSGNTNVTTEAVNSIQEGLKFPVADLPLLMNALRDDYKVYGKDLAGIQEALVYAVRDADKELVFEFIKTNYPTLKQKKENVRQQMINILSAAGTAKAYGLIKELLISDPPATAAYETALENFKKFPALTATLFPELGVKIKDADMAPVILELAVALCDTKHIDYNSLKPYEDDITGFAKKILQRYQQGSSDLRIPHTNAVLDMLTRIDKRAAKNLLDDFLSFGSNQFTAAIIVAKVKNNQPVSTEMMERYAELPVQRVELYDQLFKIGKQSAFKGQYANQKSFAEAFTKLYVNDRLPESVPRHFELFAIKDAVVNGVQSRYYIYRITCQFTRSTEVYTSIIGSFSTDPYQLSIKEGKEAFILYKQKIDAAGVDRLFENFIDQLKNPGSKL